MIYEIEKHYGKSVKYGKYKIGLTAKFRGDIKSKEQLKKVSGKLLAMLRETVEEEMQTLIDEEEEQNE